MLNKARSFYSKLDQEGKDTVQMGCVLVVGVSIMILFI